MHYSGNIEQGYLVYPRVIGSTYFEWINAKRAEFVNPGCTPARRADIRKASFRILIDVIEALLQFHGAGWIHRDVHTANIMVEQDTGRALLIDTQLAARMTGVGGELPCVPTPAAQSYWVHEDSGTRHQGPLTDAYSVAALVVMTYFSRLGPICFVTLMRCIRCCARLRMFWLNLSQRLPTTQSSFCCRFAQMPAHCRHETERRLR